MVAPPTRKIGLAAWYTAIYGARGFGLAPHHYPIVAGLEDHRINNLLMLGPPGLGKSSLLSSVYPAWELGHDPTLTILSVSAGERLPQGFMAATAQIIQHDRTWKELFPDVRPSPDLGWSRQNGLYVTGHHPSDPDASFVSIGLSSMALTGLHARLHIYDDVHDRNNSATPDGRAQVIRTYYDTLMGRADPRGCRRIAAGRWWAEDDLYQEWMRSGDWVVLQLPASRMGQARLWYDVYVPKGLQCVFTETLPKNPVQDEASAYVRYRAYYGAIDPTKKGFYWPASPSKRQEYEAVKRRQPRIAAINYDGDMLGATEAVFKDSDFVPYIPPEGLATGISDPQVYQWIKAMGGEVEQAWDTALGQPMSESWTVSLTGLLVPCSSWHCGEDENLIGKCDFHYDVYLLDAMVKDIDFRQLALALRSEFNKWAPIMVTVEEKQSGVGLLQTFKGSHIPIRGQKIDQGKLERAVNPVLQAGLPIPGGAASVQGWGRMGRIRYPIGARWITHGPKGDKENGFLKKVLSFKGGTYGTDEFDALIHLVTRAIIRSHRHGRIGFQAPVDLESIDLKDRMHLEPRLAGLNVINQLFDNRNAPSLNPFAGFCGSCRMTEILDNREWCSLHGRATTAFNGCSYWKDKTT